MRLTFGKGVAFGLALASGLLGTTAAMAGTGVGSIFNLGKTNTVNATSAVKGTASGPTLKLTNTGAGPALSLRVGTSAAPLTVNSSAQVANLNASLLGGLGAASFVQGGGRLVSAGLTLHGGQSNVTLLTIPGYGQLTADCTAGSAADGAQVFYINGTTAATAWAGGTAHPSGPVIFDLAAGHGISLTGLPSTTSAQSDLTVQYTTKSGLLVFQHIATAQVDQSFDESTSTCQFVAQATAGPGSQPS